MIYRNKKTKKMKYKANWIKTEKGNGIKTGNEK